MKYRDGYDGQLVNNYSIQLPFVLYPDTKIQTEFITITAQGKLTIHAGYAWDYATVPIIHKFSNRLDGRKSKVPSLVHDALCQLRRVDLLPMDPTRKHTDRLFYDMLIERGFWRIRAWLWYKAVRIGAKYGNQEPKKIYCAP